MKFKLDRKSLLGFMKVFTGKDAYRNLPVYFLQEDKNLRVFVKVVREYVPDKGDKLKYDPFYISRTFPHKGAGSSICVEDAEKIEEICSQTDEDEIVINCDTGKKEPLTVEFATEDGGSYNLIDTCEGTAGDGDYPDVSELTEYDDKMVTYYGDGEVVHVAVADNTYATLEMYTPGDCQELTDIISKLNPKYDPGFKKGENFMVKARRKHKEEDTAQNAVEEEKNNEESNDKEIESKPESNKKAEKADTDKKQEAEKENRSSGDKDEPAGEHNVGVDAQVNNKEGSSESERDTSQKKKTKKRRTPEEIEKDNFDWCLNFLDERGYDAVKREMSIEDALANIIKCANVIKEEKDKPLDKETLLEQLQTHLKE